MPNVVLLQAGTWDIQDGDASGAADRLSALIDEIHKDDPGAVVAVATLAPTTNAADEALVIAYNTSVKQLVTTTIQHRGVLVLIGMVGILYGGSNVGGVFSTVFQPIFEVNGRDFLKEKALDVGMIFVFVALMVIIIVSTTAGAVITRFFPTAPIPGGTAFLLGTTVSLAAAFLLFVVLYEEPTLRETFGADYVAYCREVPRWVPRLIPGVRGGDRSAS